MKNLGKNPILQSYIGPLIRYVRDGAFPKNELNSFMNSYSFVTKYCDTNDDKGAKSAYLYYQKLIENFCKECSAKIENISNDLIIEEFINMSKKIKIFIHFLIRLFSCLDNHYLKANKKDSLIKTAFNIYKNIFIESSRQKVYEELNKLFTIDRKGNKEKRRLIILILEIIKVSDITEPMLVIQNFEYFWVRNIKLEPGEKISTKNQDKWFNEYFIVETIKYGRNKAKDEIQKMSTLEYSLSQLKYLEEEKERMKEINPKYHPTICLENYKVLVSEVIKWTFKIVRAY